MKILKRPCRAKANGVLAWEGHEHIRRAARAEIAALGQAECGCARAGHCACGIRLSRADVGGICLACRAEQFQLWRADNPHTPVSAFRI